MSLVKTALRRVGHLPGFRGPYLFLRVLNSSLRDRHTARAVLRSRANRGHCSICEKQTVFIERTDWLRDEYFCVDCYSIPRQRALIHVLQEKIPDWRDLVIHESSADGVSSDKIAAECSGYSSSQYMPDVEPGGMRDGIRCENLEAMTFADDSFDVFITQDVFEHVLAPGVAFREVARVLRPGGAHVFTIPLYQHEVSVLRARRGDNGETVNLLPPDYHGDPAAGAGWLVATEWGNDFTKFIEDASGLKTDVVKIMDPALGLKGEFLEVFVSTKVS